jgi:hypothetical protein
MTVRIVAYDPRSGKGTYETEEGEQTPFRYTQFHEQKLIPTGEYADLQDGVLHPVATNWLWKTWRRMTWR